MQVNKYVGALLLLFGLSAPAMAAEKIQFDGGGSVVEYIQKYTSLRNAEGKVEVDGACISACTLFLGLMPKDSVCATPFGLLGFHSASLVHPLTGERKHSKLGTDLIWNIYPKEVRERLKEKGWDAEDADKADHHDIIYFPATDFVKACNA
jgi:hypothetical protein